MDKDFDTWNGQKKRVNNRTRIKYHVREMWWCWIGLNVGSEQDGSGAEFRRPVLIVKGLSLETCIIVPLTKSTRDHPLRIKVGLVAGEEARAVLSQIKVIDVKRLAQRIGYLDQTIFDSVRKNIQKMF